MSNDAKKQTEQHIIDRDGQALLRARLPRHWVLREYRPDYGIDFALEIFGRATADEKGRTRYQTLGEHVFVQLKSLVSTTPSPLQLFARRNVEKTREVLDKADLVGQLETARLSIETTELVTIERMGVGVPVLLVVADLSRSKCYFVCLNDYIDKILIPRHDDYRAKDSRTIHVPTANEVGEPFGEVALRWYAKRAKLYAAFARFAFQAAELDYEWDLPSGMPMARYFASRLAAYDFWDDTEMWKPIGLYGAAVRRFLSGAGPGLTKVDSAAALEAAGGDAERAKRLEELVRLGEVPQLWRLLAVLPRNYEDVCREWFLPTSLGYACSYESDV